jgi:general secretion pathway protein D
VANLDQPVADDDNMETRYLKYARAETVATMLKNMTGTILAQTSGNAGAAGAAAGPGAGASSASADRAVNIQFDAPTNMLIIMAPTPTRRVLMRIVDDLDIARAQVQIEAIIADVSVDKSQDLGVNWAVFSQEDGVVVPGALFDAPVGGTDIATLATTVADPSTATSVPLGGTFAIGKLVDNGISWATMLRLLASDSNTNVIANPTQVTLDNQEVNLESGQEVPLLSGSYTTGGVGLGGGLGGVGGGGGAGGGIGGGIGNPFTTVNRTQLGTKLKITPQLNGSDAMTLTIDLESSELAGSTGDAGSAITNVRKFHNVVLVKDQQWIVVGGLIRDSETSAETRVPFVSRIPLLGNLFKTKSKQRSKKNLMVFIRPTIITDNLDADTATRAKYGEILDAQKAQRENTRLPSPQLPDLLPSSGSAAPGGMPQTSPVP